MNYSDIEKEIQAGIEEARRAGVVCGDAACISIKPCSGDEAKK